MNKLDKKYQEALKKEKNGQKRQGLIRYLSKQIEKRRELIT